jgi:LAO/AO transport system kinase
MALSHIEHLARQIQAGDRRSVARGLTWIESGGQHAEALSEQLYPSTGRAHVVGITGSAGVGKSTLTRGLVRQARARGRTVGVLAIDPSSPFSGGSILGDRIRMNDLWQDDGVFIRSMATRGALGGLSHATPDAIDLLDASGKDLILVETVGVGQDEVDVMRFAQTVILVSAPGLGDDIQALKAGLVEIADVHVVNKADRDGAARTAGDLAAMVAMTPHGANDWIPPVKSAVALRDEGIDALYEEMQKHLDHLNTSGELRRRRRRTAEARVLGAAQAFLSAALRSPISQRDQVEEWFDRVVDRALTPRACARALLRRVGRDGQVGQEGRT